MYSREERCRNFNHTKSNVSIRYCPDCGEKVNAAAQASCNDTKHAKRMKDRNAYCYDCGKTLRP